MNIRIQRNSDPFRKYWWVILLVFGLVGGWVCLPLLDSQTGSGSIARESGLRSANQSLDALSNPDGAPGSVADLSMEEGSYRKRTGGSTMASSLYEAPDNLRASTAAVAASGGSSLADALKFVAAKKAAVSASADPTGWKGVKPQKGFTAPRASFGAMSGFGGSSASSASSGAGLSAFGGAKSNPGTAYTQGLRGDGGGAMGGGSMNALRGAASSAISAAGARSGDAAVALGGRSFDGGGGTGSIGGGGQSTDAGGVYNDLDAAPANLKAGDPTLDLKKIEPPPAELVKDEKDSNAEMRERITQMIVMAVVGGVISGFTGGILGAAGLSALPPKEPPIEGSGNHPELRDKSI